MSDHGAQFLSSQLEGSIADKENCSSAVSKILGCECSTLASTNGPADTAPENLAESSDIRRESGIPDTEVGSSGLGHDDILGDEELANARPEPSLGDGLGAVKVLLDLVDNLGDGRRRHGSRVNLVNDLAQDTPHGDTRVGGISDLAVSAVEVDRVELGGSVGETGSVEVTLESANGDEQIRLLDDLLDSGRMRSLTSKDTTIVGVVFVHSALAHGGDKDGELELVDELMHLLDDTMTDGTSINQDDRSGSSVHGLEDLLDDKVLALGVVLRLCHVDGGLKASTLDLFLNHIGGEHDVDGAGLEPASAESVINLLSNLGRLVELGHVAGDLGAHVGEDVEVAIAESVVEKHLIALGDGGRAANDVDDGDVLGEGTGEAIDGRKLTDTKGGDESSNLGDSGVAIGSIGWRETSVTEGGIGMKS
jgi:hypothetical protein